MKTYQLLMSIVVISLCLNGCGKVVSESSGGGSGGNNSPVVVSPTVTPDAETLFSYSDTGATINVGTYTTGNIIVKAINYSNTTPERKRIVVFVQDRWIASPFIVKTKSCTITCNSTPLNIVASSNINIWESTYAPVAEDFGYNYKLRTSGELDLVSGNYIKIYNTSISPENLVFYKELSSF